MHESIAITGLGMASSLGMDIGNSCAAARAGITRPSELTCMNFRGASHFGRETVDGVPQVTGHVSGIGAGFTGTARLALLGSAGLVDLISRAALAPAELAACGFHLNVSDRFIEQAYVTSLQDGNVPEHFAYPSDAWKSESTEMLETVLRRSNTEIPPANRALYFGGHAGFAVAVEQACLQIRSGQRELAIVGAIDCCVEPCYLEAAASVRLLKTGDNPVGFSPGECAAFVLCERPGARGARRTIAARIVAVSIAEDASHQFTEKPAVGHGLAEAIRKGAASVSPKPAPAFVVSDLNGTERRAIDWGHAVVRVQRDVAIGDLPLWLPAVTFGETGAAAGALATCIVTRAFERRYAPGAQALICLASDSGARGSVLVERAFA